MNLDEESLPLSLLRIQHLKKMTDIVFQLSTMSKLYEIPPIILLGLVKPLEHEMCKLGPYNTKEPTFNEAQLELLFEMIGRPAEERINQMFLEESIKGKR